MAQDTTSQRKCEHGNDPDTCPECWAEVDRKLTHSRGFFEGLLVAHGANPEELKKEFDEADAALKEKYQR